MSRVSYSRIEPFTERDVTLINTAFTSFVTQSSNLNSENFAEEGLDETAFVDGVYASRLKTVTDNGRIALPVSAAFAVFAMSGNFQTSAIGAVASGRLLRVTSAVYFESEAPGQHGIPPERLEMRHEYDAGAGTTAVLYSHALKDGATIASGLESRRHATIAIESWMFGPIANLLWVRLAYKLPGAVVAYPSKAFLVVDAFDGLLVL